MNRLDSASNQKGWDILIEMANDRENANDGEDPSLVEKIKICCLSCFSSCKKYPNYNSLKKFTADPIFKINSPSNAPQNPPPSHIHSTDESLPPVLHLSYSSSSSSSSSFPNLPCAPPPAQLPNPTPEILA